jgi:hypothetical protein
MIDTMMNLLFRCKFPHHRFTRPMVPITKVKSRTARTTHHLAASAAWPLLDPCNP